MSDRKDPIKVAILGGGALFLLLGLFLLLFMPETGFEPAPQDERNSFGAVGQTLRFALDPDKLSLFDAQSQASVRSRTSRGRSIDHLLPLAHLHDGAVGTRGPQRLLRDQRQHRVEVGAGLRDPLLYVRDDGQQRIHVGRPLLSHSLLMFGRIARAVAAHDSGYAIVVNSAFSACRESSLVCCKMIGTSDSRMLA
mgnify:CR=1 FL=1